MAFHSHCNVLTMIPSALVLLLLIAFPFPSHAEISLETAKKIASINTKGEYYGLVVSGKQELAVVLAEGYGLFQPDINLSLIDISARRFYVGTIQGRLSIVVMSGSGMVNAAQTTQLLLNLFRVRGVVFYGRGAGADPNTLNIGDVSIPRQIAQLPSGFGSNFQKFGGDESGFDRDIANLTFSEYNVGETKVANELQSVYLQREETYSVRRKPEKAKHKLWFNVDDTLYGIAKSLTAVDLGQCVLVKSSSVCLEEKPQVKTVEKGSGSNIYVNNQGYRDFLHSQLNITSIDIESAAIAMVCETENKPFIAMTTVTNHAGGSSPGNDVSVIRNLWHDHARVVIREFFARLIAPRSNLRTVTGTEM